jgi:hypothetical protein
MLIDHTNDGPPPDWQRVISGLVELRRLGHFYALYVDDWSIHIRRHMWDEEMERVFWWKAREMVDRELRKGVCNEKFSGSSDVAGSDSGIGEGTIAV